MPWTQPAISDRSSTIPTLAGEMPRSGMPVEISRAISLKNVVFPVWGAPMIIADNQCPL